MPFRLTDYLRPIRHFRAQRLRALFHQITGKSAETLENRELLRIWHGLSEAASWYELRGLNVTAPRETEFAHRIERLLQDRAET